MSLYRIYRPQTFEEVVGQDHVARTLRNALTADPPRVAHAYLFTGPRGIGKTTNARLLAKCLNCERGPTPTPCNQCDFCVRVAKNQPVMDLVEIDAASNTGVDNVRENIIDKVGMAPAQGRYRVTIIDECFAYGEPVTLADGSRVPIGAIVENQMPVEVLSYNEQTRKTEAKPIARWMKKSPHLPCVRVHFDNNRSIVCTFNHKFYTPDGQRHAAELEAGDFVYANYESLTQHQFDVVAGAAVGDGHLSLTGSKMRGRLPVTQGIAQQEFEMPVDDGSSAGLSMSRVRKVEAVAPPAFVYNIEVEDNHNYFVRDMLVANCHMLSAASFNALLKTIEEPPPHAIFILATTETHKVPTTITSRCQRFDFRRVTPADIARRLMFVAEAEKMILQPEAAKLIARHADGALRDGLTLLEQVSAFSAEEISAADVRLVLGGVPQELLDGLIESVAAQDAAGIFALIEKAVEEGASFAQLSRDLTAYARDLLLLTVGFAGDEELSASEKSNRARHAESLGGPRLERLITLLREAEKEMRSSSDHRLLLELTLVRACDGTGLSAPALPATPTPRPVVKAREVEPSNNGHAPAETAPTPVWRRATRENILAPKPKAEAAESVEPGEQNVEPREQNPELQEQNSALRELNVEPHELNVGSHEENVEPREQNSELYEQDVELREQNSEPHEQNVEPSAEVAPAKPKKGRRIDDFDSLVELWPAVLMRIRKKIGVTAVAYLHDARPVGFSDEEIVLEFTKEFHHAKATEASKRLPFEDKINETLDKPRRLKLQLAAPAPPAEAAPEPLEDDDDDDGDDLSGGDIVQYAQNMFGAEVMGRSGN